MLLYNKKIKMDQKCSAIEYFNNRVSYWKHVTSNNIDDNNIPSEVVLLTLTDLMKSCKCQKCIKNLSSDNPNSLFINDFMK